jgi:stage II sporulation protein D
VKKRRLVFLIGLFFYSTFSLLSAESFQVQIGRLFNQGKIDDVNQMILRQIQKDPDNLPLWQELAALRKSQGDYAGTVSAYQKYLARKDDWKIRRDMALMLEQMGQYSNAAADIQKLYLQHPQDEDVLWGMTLLCQFQAVSKSIRTQPTTRDALAEAQKYLLLLASAKPNSALYQWQLAEVSRKLGEKNRALKAYEAVLRLDPSFKWAHRFMAKLLAQKKNYQESLVQYEKAIAIEPDDKVLKAEAEEVQLKAPREAARRETQKIKNWKEWVLPKEIPIASSSATIRVGLAVHVVKLLIRSPSEIQVFSPVTVTELSTPPTPLAVLPAGKEYQLIYLSAKRSITHHEIWLIKSLKGKNLFRFTQTIWMVSQDSHQSLILHDIPTNKGYFYGKDEDRAYREIIEIFPKEKIGFNVINRVSLEAYTAGVLPSEMISAWPLEALKAQAIAARSYVLAKLNGYKAEGFDVADGVQDQVYGGVGSETTKTDSAVNQTAGMVLKYGGKVIPAVFSAQCGGHTQDYEEAWGLSEPIVGVPDYDLKYNQDIEFPLSPYRLEEWIKGNPVSYCRAYGMRGYRNFRWVTEVPVMTIRLKAPNVGRIRRIAVTHRSSAGWADRLVVEGDKGSQEFKGDSIRSFFGGIRSNLIWIEPQFNLKGWPEEFIIYGGGWGHGVGLCQVGAHGLADAGKSYDEILKHYFPKAEIEKL